MFLKSSVLMKDSIITKWYPFAMLNFSTYLCFYALNILKGYA